MGKSLVICEKPDQAKNYSAAMEIYGKMKRENGYYENDKYIFTYGFGHILSSKGMSEYKEFTEKPNKGWSWDAIPFFPPGDSLDYHVTDKGKVQQYKIIGELLKRSDVDLVINAADAGREGDLIFWELYDNHRSKKPVKRLWCSTYVHSDVQDAFKKLRDADFYLPRKASAYSRQYADWALGMNLTVGFTIKANMGRALHVGRVQTPTIALLVDRKHEIENFKPEDYFEIEAEFGKKYKGKWFKNQLGNTRLDKKEDAQVIVDRITGKIGTVVKKDVNKEPENPKKLYNLNDLQREASKKFGFNATKTLDIAQELYETYAILSYPRTDSRFLATVHVSELDIILRAISTPSYEKFVDDIISRGIPTGKHFVNDKEVTDHHAIIPTKKVPDLSAIVDNPKKGLRRDEILKVYDLVVKRFLSVFYPAAIYEKTEIVTEVEKETFKTSGKILVSAGWKEIYGADVDDDDDDEEVSSKKKKKVEEKVKVVKLPPIALGETNPVTQQELQAKQTKPPSHYTLAELLGIMEDPRKLLDDDDLKAIMKEAKAGLGTGATRAGIIDNIVNRGYVELKGKSYIATDLADKLISIAPEELKSPIVTAEWEQKLMDMEQEKVEESEFKTEIREYVEKNLRELNSATLSIHFGHISDGKEIGTCPTCKTAVKEKKKVYSCETESCFVLFKEMAGKKISEAQAKQLLAKGETAELKGFKSKAGKTFAAKLIIKEGKVAFGFESNETTETSMKCPVCHGKMIDKGTFITCENDTQEKHCFKIYKTVASKKLTDKQLEQLITKGETDNISGFKSKAGKVFSAKLKVKGTGVEFGFDSVPQEKKEMGMKCPFCGNDVVENAKAFGCTNWQGGCKFTIWKVMSGKTMTEKIVKELIQNGKTTKLDGFKSKAGKPFSATISLNKDEKKVELLFD